MRDLRPGIILTVTGIVALAHYFVRGAGSGPLSPTEELIAAIVLLVLGMPLLVIAVRARRRVTLE